MIPWLSGELPHVLQTLRSLFHAEASASYHLVHQTVNISFLVFKLPASLGTALAVPERRRAHSSTHRITVVQTVCITWEQAHISCAPSCEAPV